MIDLHTHSSCSDGVLSPQALVDLAGNCGVTCLSITDHDSLAAYRQPLLIPEGMQLIPGIELSSTWRGSGIHLVGLAVDPGSSSMIEAESAQGQARQLRFEKICDCLVRRGLQIDRSDLASTVKGVPGRPHLAQYLVDTGQVKNTRRAFQKYLSNSRLGFAQTCWPGLAHCIDWVHKAGGVAVLAHPLKYGFSHNRLGQLMQDFSVWGGKAVEVISGPQDAADTRRLQGLADQYGLLPSVGSDHHGPRGADACLGIDTGRVAGISDLLQRLYMQ